MPVKVTAGDREIYGRSDRGGHVDIVARDHGLEPGWQQVVVEAQGTDPVAADVFIVADDVRFGLVSDIDDTVITTMLPRPDDRGLQHLRPAGQGPSRRARHGADVSPPARGPPGGADRLRLDGRVEHRGRRSTASSSRTASRSGPLMLTDWGPTNTGWFRSGQDHKRTCLHRLARDFPDIRWLLVGDDGQHDPQLYAEFAEARPDRVDAICIRHLSPTEQVLSNPMKIDAPARTMGPPHRADATRRPDGHALLRTARASRGASVRRWPQDEQPSRPASASPTR